MSKKPEKKFRGSRRQRLKNRLTDYVMIWVVVVLCAGFLALGFVGGLFAGRPLRADWVTAIGTWVGGFGAIGAGLMAYRIYRAEALDRAIQRSTEGLRHAEQAEQVATRKHAPHVWSPRVLAGGLAVTWARSSANGG